jgi:hypothetical protein
VEHSREDLKGTGWRNSENRVQDRAETRAGELGGGRDGVGDLAGGGVAGGTGLACGLHDAYSETDLWAESDGDLLWAVLLASKCCLGAQRATSNLPSE